MSLEVMFCPTKEGATSERSDFLAVVALAPLKGQAYPRCSPFFQTE